VAVLILERNSMPFALDRYWRLLAAYLSPHRGRLAALALLIVCGIGLQIVGPQLIGRFIDGATSGGAQNALLWLAVAYIAAGLVQRAASLGAAYVGENLGWKATNSLRADLARHVVGLDLGFHKAHTPGELIERIDGDVTALANFFSQFSVFVLANALLIGGVLVALWLEDWRVGLGLACYALLSLGALGGLQRIGQRRWERARAARAREVGFLEERLQGTEDIRASGAEAHTLRQFDELIVASQNLDRSARIGGNISYAATNFLSIAGYAMGLLLGASLFLAGATSIGGAYLIVAYIGMLAAPLDRLREQAQDLQRAGASIDRVSALFAEQPLVRERVTAALPGGALGVELHGVTFSYEDGGPQATDDPSGKGTTEQGGVEGEISGAEPLSVVGRRSSVVLDSIDLKLAPGETLGLLGRTGSGKTTLTRLLFRLYDPQAGAVHVGGVDLRGLGLDDLRGRVGMVTQDVQLFQASVRQNLTLFDRGIDDARLEAALRTLGLWEWVCRLPQGLDTPLGGGGHGLSAGEAQLLAFTRVFLKNPGLLILDEASSRLDPATERLLERAIDRLLEGRTAIVIAHRLGTVARADSIAILDGGRLVEHGRRVALADNPASRFSRLLRAGIEEVLV
jgi:ATP-binding cassette subfamily B protein